MRNFISFHFILFYFIGCGSGHQDFIDFKNDRIGKEAYFTEPYKYDNAGTFSRGNFEVVGKGFTHITKNRDENLFYHIDESEILSNFTIKEWVGKCKYYYIVDSKTGVVKGWKFEENTNPLSCRTWP